MKKFHKLISLLLAAAMLCTLLAACGASEAPASVESSAPTESLSEPEPEAPDPETPEENLSAEEVSPEEASAEEEEPIDPALLTENYFPLDTQETISYWVTLRAEEASLLENLSDSPGWTYVAEALNVDLEFTCASQAAATEQFNLMVASEDYTDILSSIDYYSGGAPKAFEDEVIIDLKEYVDLYCNNYRTMIEEQGLTQTVQTDEGHWLIFYPVYEEFKTLSGFTVRQDFLDQLNMEAPVTYDDFEEYAAAVKSEFGVSDPLLMTSDTNTFVTGFNVTGFSASAENTGIDHLFQRDGVVTSSFLEEDYKDYLKLMNQWYEKGYIGTDFYSYGTNTKASDVTSLILNGDAGLYENSANEMSGHEQQASVEGFALTGVGEPRKTVDSVVHVSDTMSAIQTMNAVCISSNCDNVELASHFIDWFYTEEGKVVSCYGIPSFVTTDETGMYVYTDEAVDTFTNNQWNTTYGNAQRLYKAMLAGRKTQDDMYLKWGMDSKEVAAVELWNSEYYTDDYRLPVTLSLTTEESSRAASIASEISTFAAERMAGYITGERTWEEYDTMVEQLQDMGLQELIDIYQDAMDRYLSR